MSSAAPPKFDKEGFLLDLNEWNRDVAHRLAATEGLVLADSHWQIIDLLRDFFERTETSPAMRPLVKLVKEHLGEDCGSSVYLMGLFGAARQKPRRKLPAFPARPTVFNAPPPIRVDDAPADQLVADVWSLPGRVHRPLHQR